MLIFFSLASRKTQVYYFVNLSSVPQKHQGKFWTKGEFERATIGPPKVCFQISLHQVDSTGLWREGFYFIFPRLHFWVLFGGWISRCQSQFCCANSALHASHSRTWRSDSAPLQKIPCPPDFLAFVPLGFWLKTFRQLQNNWKITKVPKFRKNQQMASKWHNFQSQKNKKWTSRQQNRPGIMLPVVSWNQGLFRLIDHGIVHLKSQQKPLSSIINLI